MGSTFGKVRKYNLHPADDSATPLKFSSVPEDQVSAKVPPLAKSPDDKHPPTAHLGERTPNYGQLLPDHLRYSVDGMYIPRTSSSVGHHFSKKIDGSSHPATSSFKGPPEPPRQAPGVVQGSKRTLDSAAEQRLKPKQKHYSSEDLNRILDVIRCHNSIQPGVKEPISTPCRYCKGLNPVEYRSQYVYEPDPPPYRPISTVTTPSRLGERLPFVHTPTGKHYHIIEVNPYPHLFNTRDKHGPLHTYGRYNVMQDSWRPNLPTRRNSEVNMTQTANVDEEITGQRVKEPPLQNSNTYNSTRREFPHEHQGVKNNNITKRHTTSHPTGFPAQPFIHSDLKTNSLPHKGNPHHCYTIPEESVDWAPPFRHTQSMQHMGPGGFRP